MRCVGDYMLWISKVRKDRKIPPGSPIGGAAAHRFLLWSGSRSDFLDDFGPAFI
jgi:hypothetical protein